MFYVIFESLIQGKTSQLELERAFDSSCTSASLCHRPPTSFPSLAPGLALISMCKPASASQAPLIDSGNGSETGGVHFELLHGVSFGSGALLIIMIVFLYYLRLRWKKENKGNCN